MLNTAIIATIVSSITAITIFLLKEWLDRLRHRRRAAIALVLYSRIVDGVLKGDGTDASFTLKDVIDSSNIIFDIREVPILICTLDICMSTIKNSTAGRIVFNADRKSTLSKNLNAEITKLSLKFKLN